MQRVWHLPPKPGKPGEFEERCVPDEFVCTKKFKCLRFRAEHDKGLWRADHSTLGDDCKFFLPLTSNEKAP